MRAGVLFGIAAYGLWGLFPIYFHALDDAGAIEVVAHRIGWSLLVVLVLLAVTRKLHAIRELGGDRRKLLLLSGAAVLIAINWGVYIYAVDAGHVLEAALGYFITPLISVALGMTVFGERLRPAQAAALALGTVAVVVLSVYHGGFPWISLVLGASFGTYGLLKKLADVGAAESLAVETSVLFLPALAVIVVLAWTGGGAFATGDLSLTLLLVVAGPVTALPLLLFAACVTRVPLSVVGLLQYLTPVLQFLIGWLAYDEVMSTARWVGFALVWLALIVLTFDGLRLTRSEPLTPEATAV
jgi:chloramphenicol-sensitive protein RarD